MSGRNIALTVSNLGLGGAERVASTLSNAWASRGDSVSLITTFSRRDQPAYTVCEQVDILHLADTVRGRSSTVSDRFLRLLALRRLIRKLSPDVVISFLTNVNVATLLATRGLGVPVIVCERTNPMKQRLSLGLTLQRRLLYRMANAVAVQSEELAAAIGPRWHGARRVEVIPNPLPSELPPMPALTGSNVRSRRRLLAMGRLVELKQFSLLIDVFGSLCPAFPEWDMHIFGDGPTRRDLSNQILHLGLSERVFLRGGTDTPWEELAKADVFVMTSRYEGFPNALLEAMAIGLPCVSFDCPFGPREISCAGEHALLVPTGDKDGLATALARVMGNEALRQKLGMRAAVSVRSRYSLSQVLAQWDRVFNELLAPAE